MTSRSAVVISLLILMSSCKSYYTVSNFEDLTDTHTTVAILPFEVQTMGVVNPSITPEMIDRINESESRAFQISFHNQVLESTRRCRKPLRVSIQHYSKTLGSLEENGISVIDSWIESPENLANMLGVDAVVRGPLQ